MQAFVVDTSAWVRWRGLDDEKAMEEGYPPEMDDVYERAGKGQAKVFAPDWLMRVEVTNVVVFQKHIKSKAITRDEADAELVEFDTCGHLVTGVPDRELFARAPWIS